MAFEVEGFNFSLIQSPVYSDDLMCQLSREQEDNPFISNGNLENFSEVSTNLFFELQDHLVCSLFKNNTKVLRRRSFSEFEGNSAKETETLTNLEISSFGPPIKHQRNSLPDDDLQRNVHKADAINLQNLVLPSISNNNYCGSREILSTQKAPESPNPTTAAIDISLVNIYRHIPIKIMTISIFENAVLKDLKKTTEDRHQEFRIVAPKSDLEKVQRRQLNEIALKIIENDQPIKRSEALFLDFDRVNLLRHQNKQTTYEWKFFKKIIKEIGKTLIVSNKLKDTTPITQQIFLTKLAQITIEYKCRITEFYYNNLQTRYSEAFQITNWEYFRRSIAAEKKQLESISFLKLIKTNPVAEKLSPP